MTKHTGWFTPEHEADYTLRGTSSVRGLIRCFSAAWSLTLNRQLEVMLGLEEGWIVGVSPLLCLI